MLVHGSDEELLHSVVPFLRDGLSAGDGVLVCCRPATAGLVQRGLGDRPGISYLGYEQTYSTPVGAVAAYQERVDSLLLGGVERVRVVAEAVYDRSADERVEWARYEAVANRAMEPYPVSAVCLYDTRLVPGDLLALGRLAHPLLVSGTNCSDNPDYVEPARFLRQTNEAVPDPTERQLPDLDIGKVAQPAELRRQLELCLFQTMHMAREAADLILAVNEVTTNALRHGRPPVRIRLWVRSDRCVCTISDCGPGIRDPFAGYIWPGTLSPLPTHGMGLWLARRLCDRVDIVNSPEGCTVRLIVHRGKPAAGHGR